MPRSSRPLGLFLASALLVPFATGCGANVVIDGEAAEGGAGGAGGAGGSPTLHVTSTGPSTATSTSTSTGVGGGGPNLVEELVVEGVTTEPVKFEVTPGTLGITAVAIAEDDPFAEVTLSSVTAPSGSLVFDTIFPSNGWAPYWYGALAGATPQISHPETFPVANGTWTFQFGSSTPTRVSIWRRATTDGAFHGGVLDVNVFVPDGIIADVDLTNALADAFNDWGGIELGEVRVYSVSDEYVAVDDQNVFALLEETAVASGRPALNIMGTLEIGGSFEGAAGFSLGLPGVPVLHGTSSSAVVWQIQNDDYFDAIILRHEAGHYAGLFHTSEYEPGLVDPLDDSPACSDVIALYDTCPDYDYSMFPSGGSGAGLFSQQEAKVLQGSAIYRGVFAPGEQPMSPYGPPLDEETSGMRLVAPGLVEAAKARAASHGRTAGSAQRSLAGSWAANVAPHAATHLAGIGCPAPDGSSYFDELAELGVNDAGALVDIASDDAAPAYVRRRALLMIARLESVTADVVDTLDALARDEQTPSVVRSGALRALAVKDPERGTFASIDLERDADRLVRRTASTLQ